MEEEFKSKAQLKKDMDDLFNFVKKLVSLSNVDINRLNISDRLKKNLCFAKEAKGGATIKIHLKTIRGYIVDEGEEEVKAAYNDLFKSKEGQTLEVTNWLSLFKEDSKEATRQWFEKFPESDRQQLNQINRNFQKELKENKINEEKELPLKKKQFNHLKSYLEPFIKGE